MRQKLLGIMAIFVAVMIALAFTACDNGNKNPHTHTWDNWIETTPPTCTTAGIKTRTCTDCGETDTQTQEGTAALGHDWNTVKEVISTVSETTDSLKAITCKRDKTHTKDEEIVEYATGSAGLAFTLITTGDYADTYEVKRGTFDGSEVFIPAYHRETADDDYIPVTSMSGFGRTSPNPPPGVTTLTAVTFAAQSQLRSIEWAAFRSCTSLANITIPASVTSIDSSAFGACASLTSITVNANNPNYASEGGILYNKDKTTLIAYPSASGSITIPTSVTSIGNGAFSSCTSLTNVEIPAGVTFIGNSAFSSCTSLTSVTIPASVTSIDGFAFGDCTNLASITIPEGVTSIGQYAFLRTSLTSVIIPASVTSIGDNAFSSCTSLASVTILEGVTSIGGYAFSSCTNLASVIIPDSVTSIYQYAFYGCTSLASITLPEGLKVIVYGTFFNCTSLASITIPTSVTTIGPEAFTNCTSLTSITIPANVAFINNNGPSPFSGWTNTQTINVPFANVSARPVGWPTDWNQNCNAVIKYWNGTTWE